MQRQRRLPSCAWRWRRADKPLLTQALRQQKEAERLERYPYVVLRIALPQQLVLQAVFRPLVRPWPQSCSLACASGPWLRRRLVLAVFWSAGVCGAGEGGCRGAAGAGHRV